VEAPQQAQPQAWRSIVGEHGSLIISFLYGELGKPGWHEHTTVPTWLQGITAKLNKYYDY
jgi:hypothetical protein